MNFSYSIIQDFGQDISSSAVSNSSSCLPSGWNSSQDVYALQYRHDATKKACLVKAILMEGQLLVNAMVGELSSIICSKFSFDSLEVAGNTSEVVTITVEMAKYVKDDTAFNSPRYLIDSSLLV